MSQLLFPRLIATRKWIEINARGFNLPASAFVYRASQPAICGMPLGGIGTGCIDLDTNGTFGYSSIFNSLWPRAGPLNTPFLGISVGPENWMLSTLQLKNAVDGSPDTINLRRGKPAQDILYWGHYPVADLEYFTDCPIQVALRAWSPFIPGDLSASSVPCCVFTLILKNPTALSIDGTVAFSFPGPAPWEVEDTWNFQHQKVNLHTLSEPTDTPTSLSGISILHTSGVGYVIGVVDRENIFTGGGLGVDGGAWSRIGAPGWVSRVYGRGYELPSIRGQADASILVPFTIKQGEEQELTFIVAWYAPKWDAGGRPDVDSNKFLHYYGRHFPSAIDIAKWITVHYRDLLNRIISWQQVIYSERDLPVWLRESLVNIMHLITECGVWAQAMPPIGTWCRPEEGLFALNESPRGCPQLECIPCSFYGNFPLVYFFPELALSTLRAYKAYQFEDGQAPWIFGGCTDPHRTPPYELTMPSRGYRWNPQTALDGTCYASIADRFFLCSAARDNPTCETDSRYQELMKEFYESLKENLGFTMNLRPEAKTGGAVMAPSGDKYQDWFEGVKLAGIIPHLGGIHLAHLKIIERLASIMRDDLFVLQCQKWFEEGKALMEAEAWQGNSYYLYADLDTGVKNRIILGYQLDGEWIARMHGCASVFEPDRIKKTLETLKTSNITQFGARVFYPNGETNYKYGYWGECGMHVGGTLMLAMLYIYDGDREFGLEIARRAMHTISAINGGTWDSPIVFSCNNGQITYGNDYYQNLVLWTLPAALEGGDCSISCRAGGLIDRILKAGRKERT